MISYRPTRIVAALTRATSPVRVVFARTPASRLRAGLALCLTAVLLTACTPPDRPTGLDSVVVFLVRHAERAEDGTSDPPISEAGERRSSLLARMVADAGLTHIHTTDYIRTRATGDPTAEVTGLEMALYDPDDLDGFARRLRATSGRHLVLGHSNTTPELVAALGGDPGPPIDEMEYDRLYIVSLTRTAGRGDQQVAGPTDRATTVLLRFGEPFGNSGGGP